MKKNKILALLSVGALALSLASCDFGLSDLLMDSDKTEISNVTEDTEVVEPVIEDDTTDDEEAKTDDTEEAKTETDTKEDDESKEESTPEVTVGDDVILTKYQLLATNLYLYEEDYHNLYGYQSLGEDYYYGSLMQDVYEEFYLDAHNFLASDEDYEVYTSTDFNYIILGEYEYTNYSYTDVIASAWITFIEENPIYYFTYTGYTIKTEGSGKNKTYSFCFLGGTDYAKAEDRYEAGLSILNLIDDFNTEYYNLESKDDYTVAKMIHDYICNKISYAYDENGNASEAYWAHNILGVSLKNSGVCECYAETYLFLSYLTDLDTLIVLGESGGGGHVWNYVKVDDIWYGLDATWDDGDTISYNYFLVSSKVMNQGHSANNSSYYGIDYQVTMPTLSESSYDKSLDDQVPTSTPRYPYIVYPIIIVRRPRF